VCRRPSSHAEATEPIFVYVRLCRRSSSHAETPEPVFLRVFIHLFLIIQMRGCVGNLLPTPRPQNLFRGCVEGLVWSLIQIREIGMGRVCGLIEGFWPKP